MVPPQTTLGRASRVACSTGSVARRLHRRGNRLFPDEYFREARFRWIVVSIARGRSLRASGRRVFHQPNGNSPDRAICRSASASGKITVTKRILRSPPYFFAGKDSGRGDTLPLVFWRPLNPVTRL